jgi:hypothetical protein
MAPNWMFHDLLVQFPEGFEHVGCNMGTGIAVQQHDTL